MSEASDRPVGIGVIGAASFVATAAVMPAIDAVDGAEIVAVCSRGGSLDDRWSHLAVEDYDDVVSHPDVEAVYVPLPNGMHREWTERCAAAGRHVLCEKPLAPDAATAVAMADACERAGVLLAEAYMTPFHGRYRHVLDMVRQGAIGEVERIDARFTFTISEDRSANYRWRADQGGGALLDVGIYCLGPIVELFGAEPDRIDGGSSPTGPGVGPGEFSGAGPVDAATHAVLTYPGRRHGAILCSFVDDERQSLVLHGSAGRIELSNEAFTGSVDDRGITVDTGEGAHRRTVSANDSYRAMVAAFADAVRGRAEWPRPVERSIEMLNLIDHVREATR